MFSVRTPSQAEMFFCVSEKKKSTLNQIPLTYKHVFFRNIARVSLFEYLKPSQHHRTTKQCQVFCHKPFNIPAWRLGARFRDVYWKAVSASRFSCWTDFTMTMAQKGILTDNLGRYSKTKTIILIIILTRYHVNMPSKSDNREVERKCAVLKKMATSNSNW